MKKAEEKIQELLERSVYNYQSEVVHQSCFGKIVVETCLTKRNLIRYMVTFKTPEGKKTFSCLDECSKGQAGYTICLEISKIVNDIRKNMCFLRKFGFSMSGYGVFRSGEIKTTIYKRHEFGRRIFYQILVEYKERGIQTNKSHFGENLKKALPKDWWMLLGDRTRDWLLSN